MSTRIQSPRGERPGAMTMAMRAVESRARERVLRVGVVCGARVVEERVLDAHRDVSVGTSEACSFTLASESLPPRFDLFVFARGRYSLRFTQEMDGRVFTPEGVRSLAELGASGRARRAGDGVFDLALDEHSRGKVTVGDVTLLFQFVVPPPAQPRPQLPVAIRARPLRNMDWAYNSTLAGFLFLAFTALGYVEYGYDPEVQDNFELASRLVTAVENPPDPTSVEPVRTDEGMAAPTPGTTPATPNNPAPRSSNTPRGGTSPSARPAAESDTDRANAALDAARRASDRALRALADNADWAVLAAAADNAHRHADDRIAQGGTMHIDVETLGNAGGVSTGGPSAGLTRHGNSIGPIGDPNSLGRTQVTHRDAPQIDDGGPAGPGAPTGTARTGAPRVTGEGELDAGAVARLIGSRLGGIRACYNLELRHNPTLSGRLTVSFTISTDGRIHGTPNTSGMSQASNLGQCVSQRIQGIVFPQPVGGAVSFAFPFAFDANDAGR